MTSASIQYDATKQTSSHAPLSNGVPSSALRKILPTATQPVGPAVSRFAVRNFRRGEILPLTGSGCDTLVHVQRGFVNASTSLSDGREFIIDVFSAGSVIGELEAMRRQPLDLEYKAASDCELHFYDGRLLRQMCASEPELQEQIMKSAFARIVELERRLITSAGSNLISRLAHALLRLANIYSADPQQAQDEVIISQYELAATLPASREKVNQGLRRLRQLKIIGGPHGRIVILNRKALEACARDGSRFS